MSTSGCKGPVFLVSEATFSFLLASCSYALNNSNLVSLEIEAPGFIMLTIDNPILTAITVVMMYVVTVIPPIFENFEISFKSEIPFINDARIRGIAISLRALIKIVPKGLIQSAIICLP